MLIPQSSAPDASRYTPSGALRFAVALSGRLRPWQAACLRALAESEEALLVAFLDVSGRVITDGPMLQTRMFAPRALPLERSATKVDFVLSFAEDRLDSTLFSASVWRLQFHGIRALNRRDTVPEHSIDGTVTAAVEVVASHGRSDGTQILHRAVLRALMFRHQTLRALRRVAPAVCVGACRRLRDGIVASNSPQRLTE